MTVKIYTLHDPRTDEIRYVGKTSVEPEIRFTKHLYEKRHTRKCRWVQGLRKKGLKPRMEVVAEYEDEATANRAEQLWIQACRLAGDRLTNHTDGGEGHVGPHSPEHRRKRIEAVNKTIQDPEYVSPNRGRKFSEEHKRKLPEAKKHHWKRPEYRERASSRLRSQAVGAGSSLKLTISKIGRKQSPKTIAKRAAANRGKNRPPEAIHKTTAALRIPEARERARQVALKGWVTRSRVVSDRTRKKISDSLKQAFHKTAKGKV